MNIILLGAPGSGKGTQSACIAERYQLKSLSTGDILRAEIAAGSALGAQAKAVMDRGELVSDEIVIAMIAKRLDANQGTLFDGFPRTLAQAQALDTLLTEKDTQIDFVIELQVGHEEIIQRMLARGRDDDNETTIRNRLEVFAAQTQPLIGYYREQGKLHTVNGTGKLEDITARITRILG